ncbi:hypothetical protein Tco_0812395 [Tanacetum coccineum]
MESQSFKHLIIQYKESIAKCIVERPLHAQEIQKRLNDKKLQIQEFKVQAADANMLLRCRSVLHHYEIELEKYNSYKDCTTKKDKIPYDKDDLANIVALNQEETLTLEQEKITVLVKNLLIPLAIKSKEDAFEFENALKQEMFEDLEYVKSLEKEVDILESEKDDLSNEYDLLLQEQSVIAKPHHVNAPGPSRNSSKRVSFQSPKKYVGSNDMVHNYYLEEAKKKEQLQKDKALNSKPSVITHARIPYTANDSK